MLPAEINETFRSLGWKPERNSEKNRNFRRAFFDKKILLNISIRPYANQNYIGCHYGLYLDKFDKTVREISGEIYKFELASGSESSQTLAKNKVSLSSLSPRILSWASRQDISSAIRNLSVLPTDSVGNRPFLHLCALAYLEDVEALESYAAAFARGDRLGFVPYITQDLLESALGVARQRRAGQI